MFKAILKNATRLCEANLGTLELWENHGARLAASHGAPRAYLDAREREPLIRPDPDHPLGLIAATKRPVHVPDILALPNRGGPPARHAGARTLLAVPLLKHIEILPTKRNALIRIGLLNKADRNAGRGAARGA